MPARGRAAARPCSGSSHGCGAAERRCTPPHPGEESRSLESEETEARHREETRDQRVSECMQMTWNYINKTMAERGSKTMQAKMTNRAKTEEVKNPVHVQPQA